MRHGSTFLAIVTSSCTKRFLLGGFLNKKSNPKSKNLVLRKQTHLQYTFILFNETPLSFRHVIPLGTNLDVTILTDDTIPTIVKTVSLVRVFP